jgi:hypothetical protein
VPKVLKTAEDPFRPKKTESELLVVTRCPKQNVAGFSPDPHLQGTLHS